MADQEMQIIKNMAEAIAELPAEKKQYFMGFADGVAAMANQVKDTDLVPSASNAADKAQQ